MASYFYKGISITPPASSITAYLGNTDPDGWVICDGIQRNVSDSRYTNLVTMAIGTGTANAYTPPDYRGAFLRGSNKGTANAAATTTYGARAPDLKSSQNHITETHSHGASSGNQSATHTHTGTTSNQSSYHNHTGTTGNQSANHTHTGTTSNINANHTHTWSDTVTGHNNSNLAGLGGGDFNNSVNPDLDRAGTTNSAGEHTHTATTASSGDHTHTLTVDDNGSHTHTITTNSDPVHNHTITISDSTTNAGSETRPYNYGVNWILKL
uniref:Uncharacterized protein n=1 Tax=viral metagenome TaxID=1070528 RepID=A0A6C0LBP0_9ZZZZ